MTLFRRHKNVRETAPGARPDRVPFLTAKGNVPLFAMNIRASAGPFIREHIAFISLSCVVCGILAGEGAARFSAAVPWFFAVLTFNSGLGLRIRDLGSLRSKPWILPLHLAWLHLVMPVLAFGVTKLLSFPNEAVMGFVILSIIPISASCVVWVGIYKGNVTLAMALLLMDTVLAPFIIPSALHFMFGAGVHMDPLRMLRGLFWLLLAPTLLALTLNRLTQGGLQKVAGKTVSSLAQGAIFCILFINGGVVAPFFPNPTPLFFAILGVCFAMYCVWFGLGFFMGRSILGGSKDVISFMLCSSVRSPTTGIVIAMTYFAPLATLPIVMGMLVQPSMSSFTGKLASRYLAAKVGQPA